MDEKTDSYEAFIAGLPPERTQEFGSPEELEAAFDALGIAQPTRQLGEGDFRAHLAVTQTEHADIFLDRYKSGIAIYLEPPPDVVGLMFPRSLSGTFFANGIEVGNDMLVAFPRKSGIDISGPGPIGADSIAVSESQFWSTAESVCPGLESQDEVAFLPGNVKTLHALRQRLVELGAAPEPGPSEADVLRFTQDIISWIADSHDVWPAETAATTEARVRAAKIAQDYIRAHYRDAVSIEDLCRETGVGARTLQRCFQEYLHLTASQYLKVVRLDSVRRELAAADNEATSVTTIAIQNGWTHLGRFSVDYRKHFGEAPRETLAMPMQR